MTSVVKNQTPDLLLGRDKSSAFPLRYCRLIQWPLGQNMVDAEDAEH